MTIPKLVHLTTPHRVLPEDEQWNLEQFEKLHPDWKIKIWRDQEVDGLFERHLEKQVDLVRGLPYGVMRADIARYLFLKEEGGWYVDTDYQVLKSLNEFAAYSLVLPVSWNSDDPTNCYSGLDKVCNSVMASEAGHPFWDLVVSECLVRVREARPAVNRIEEQTGPDMLTQVLAVHRAKAKGLLTPEQKLFHPRIRGYPVSAQDYPEAYGAHWCKGSWRERTLLGKMARRTNRFTKARRIRKWMAENNYR